MEPLVMPQEDVGALKRRLAAAEAEAREAREALAAARDELEDCQERARLIGDYNRELLLKLAEQDEKISSATSTRQENHLARSSSWQNLDGLDVRQAQMGLLRRDGKLGHHRSHSASSADLETAEAPSSPPPSVLIPPGTEDRVVYLCVGDAGQRVPGLVQVTQEGLAFGQLVALVRPEELIGMRNCSNYPPAPAGATAAAAPVAAAAATAATESRGGGVVPADARSKYSREAPEPKRPSRLYSALFGASAYLSRSMLTAGGVGSSSGGGSPASHSRSGSIGELNLNAVTLRRTTSQSTVDSAAGDGGSVDGRLARSRSTSACNSDEETEAAGEQREYGAAGMGAWELVWKEGGGEGPLRRLTFEGCAGGYSYIRDTLESWSTAANRSAVAAAATSPTAEGGGSCAGFAGAPEGAGAGGGAGAGAAKPASPAGRGAAATALKDTGIPLDGRGPYLPHLSAASQLLPNNEFLRGLASAMPPRHRQSHWTLLYSTWRDGISLSTLLRTADQRKLPERTPGLLVVRDRKGHVFGGFTSEAWRTNTRYFGTGESFVFQVHPRMVMYRWSKLNQYFQFATNDSMAIGGGGHFALWLDQELHWGNSGRCDTFCSPCLASNEEFQVQDVELWMVGS